MKTAVGEVQGEALTLVNTTNTAIAAESGSLPVLGTPFMLALMEKATCEAVADLLEDDETTVGTAMNITHIKASAIGVVITAKAILTEVDGRKLTFHVTARNDKNELVGSGTVERFVVLAEKFLRKVEGK